MIKLGRERIPLAKMLSVCGLCARLATDEHAPCTQQLGEAMVYFGIPEFQLVNREQAKLLIEQHGHIVRASARLAQT